VARDIKIRAILENKVTPELKKLESSVKGTSNSMASFASVAKTAAVAFAGFKIAETVWKGLKSTADELDRIADTSKKLNIAIPAFQEISFVASQAGTSVENFSTSMNILLQNVQKAVTGDANLAQSFKLLNVELKNADGSLRSVDELFTDTVDALGSIDNATERAIITYKLFGKSAQEIALIMGKGKNSFKETRAAAREMGIVISTEAVLAGDKFNDAFGLMIAQMKRMKAEAAAPLLAGLTSAMSDLSKFMATAMRDIASAWDKMLDVMAFGTQGLAKKFQKEAFNMLFLDPVYFTKFLLFIRSLVDTVFSGFAEYLGRKLYAGIFGSLSIASKAVAVAADNMLKGMEAVADKIGLSIPEALEKNIKNVSTMSHAMSKELSKTMSEESSKLGLFGEEGDTIQRRLQILIGDFKKYTALRVQDKWNTEEQADAEKKFQSELAKLLELLGGKNKLKKEEIDLDKILYGMFKSYVEGYIKADKAAISSLEKRKAIVEGSISAYEILSDWAAKAAGAEFGPSGQGLSLISEQNRALSDLEVAYKKGLVAYQDYADGVANIDRYYAAQHRQVVADTTVEMMDYGMQVFDAFSGLANQISENQMKDIDRWEEREERRIENSLLAQEYKEAELEKLRAKAESRRKREFEEMKALRIAEAVINTAAGVVQELGKEGVYGIITGLLVAAAGAAEIATIAAESYAQGGVVPGNSFTGDKVPARVNSGEMILTQADQAMLADAIKSGGMGGQTIDASINISGNADASTVAALRGAQEKQIEQLRSLVLEAKYRGRWPE
jgi:hypothetical protein